MSGLFSNICGKILPDRTKRLMLFSALTGIVNNKGPEIEEKHLIMLNSRFSLAYRIEALRFPLFIRSSLLPDVSIKQEDHKKDYTTIANETYKRIPSWLKYSGESETITELISFFEFEFRINEDTTMVL